MTRFTAPKRAPSSWSGRRPLRPRPRDKRAAKVLRSHSATRFVGFVDPSGAPSNPDWPPRHLLAYLLHRRPLLFADAVGLRVLCWRDASRGRVGVLTGQAAARLLLLQ
ncbi:E1-like protein-activating [Phanerochaete sordida]|uniref:E1-like protein-activating n=1 Tax=Phanerochaete sordida TaxID=48140 RepID=A0A9P3LCH6_9APHY|nr:E1-like protein-activating [Phanerochaete sordida]